MLVNPHLVAPGGTLPTARRYWRLYITANVSAGFKSVTEFRLKNGGVNQCTGGTATASTEFNVNTTAAKAFDGLTTGNVWLSQNATRTTVEWLQYDKGSGNTMTGDTVEIVGENGSGSGSLNSNPQDFIIQSSPDGSTWTDVKTLSGVTWSSFTEQKTYSL